MNNEDNIESYQCCSQSFIIRTFFSHINKEIVKHKSPNDIIDLKIYNII